MKNKSLNSDLFAVCHNNNETLHFTPYTSMTTTLINKNNNVTVGKQQINILSDAKDYFACLLEQIAAAKSRIYITALYLQDDEAGRKVIDALYEAKQANPDLEVKVFVDAHRAQRGLIGSGDKLGNRGLYLSKAEHYKHPIDIHGVSVKGKEIFGVLHLKGMVFDDKLLYTGASINDVYCHQGDKYRLDRYYLIQSHELTNSFCQYLLVNFVETGFAAKLNKPNFPDLLEIKKIVAKQKPRLAKAKYSVASTGKADTDNAIQIEPLVGFGKRRNGLNSTIRKTIQQSQHSLVIFTPYFNLPKVLVRDVAKALRRGVKVTITVGDKTANDFYIADQSKFNTIGIVPYLYEMMLYRFVKRWQKFIDKGTLTIRLWKHEDNSYHLKGLIADDRYHLVTGSNINPRAWALDIENGLLIDDPQGHLTADVSCELQNIYDDTTIVKSCRDIETVRDYPTKPQKLLKRLRLTQIDKLLKNLL